MWPRKPPGKVAIIVGALSLAIVLALGIGGFVDQTVLLTYRAGWAGVPGTLFAVSCETVGSGRDQETDCSGEFGGGAMTAPVGVDIEGTSTYPSDRSYPAQLHADGQTVSVVSGKNVAYAVGGMFALLALDVFLGWIAALAVVGLVVRRPWRLRSWPVVTPFILGAVLLVAGIVSGTVGEIQAF